VIAKLVSNKIGNGVGQESLFAATGSIKCCKRFEGGTYEKVHKILGIVSLSVFADCSACIGSKCPVNNGLVVSEAESVMSQSVEPLLTEAELRNVYWSSSEFQAHYADDPADALATLDSIVDAYFASPQAETYAPSSVATVDSDVASVDVTLVKQINSYSCGPASAYMAIDGWGGTGDITGSNTTAKLKTLASENGNQFVGRHIRLQAQKWIEQLCLKIRISVYGGQHNF